MVLGLSSLNKEKGKDGLSRKESSTKPSVPSHHHDELEGLLGGSRIDHILSNDSAYSGDVPHSSGGGGVKEQGRVRQGSTKWDDIERRTQSSGVGGTAGGITSASNAEGFKSAASSSSTSKGRSSGVASPPPLLHPSHAHTMPTKGTSAQAAAASDTASPLVNYNEEELPPSDVHAFHEQAAKQWIISTICICVSIMVFSHFHLPLVVSVATLGIGAFMARKSVEDLKRDFIWDAERKRGRKYSGEGIKEDERPAESVEWLNHVIKEVWPILDPDLFVAGVDLVEDSLKALSPAIVRTVRISSVAQGTNPIRLLSIKYLPNNVDITQLPYTADRVNAATLGPSVRALDEATHQRYLQPHSAFTTGSTLGPKAADTEGAGDNSLTVPSSGESSSGASTPPKALETSSGTGSLTHSHKLNHISGSEDGQGAPHRPSNSDKYDLNDDEDQGSGKYVNVEVEFAYRRLPPPALKEANAHFLLYLGIGVKKLVKFELPVWVELSGLHGVIRLRLELIPDPPFVRHVKFLFWPKLPRMEIAAKPLRSFDIMTLPGVSPFILSSINSVLYNFVAPKSYTIDLSRFFLGSDVAMRTRSIGVICLVIHRAENLPAADLNGKSDPFVHVTFSRGDKILYTTRCLSNDLNPVWEEMTFLRVTSEDIDEEEKVRLTVFDHDRYSSNDSLGHVELPIRALYERPSEYVSSTDSLQQSSVRGHTTSTLSYHIAFFGLSKSTPKKTPTADEGKNSLNGGGTVREELNSSGATPLPSGKSDKHKPFFTDRSHPEESRSTEYAQRMREMLDGRRPANPSQLSGILSYQLHQLEHLDYSRDSQHKLFSGREGSGKKKMNSLPSTYCSVFFNDEKVFQTRTKPFSSAPYLNTGNEIFCRDWTTARLDVAVMNTADLDYDILIGFVSLDLSDILSAQSQLTKWFQLLGGEGHGRIRMSILFKPIDIEIHPNLREWNVGTFELSYISAVGLKDPMAANLEVSVEGGESATIGDFIESESYKDADTGQHLHKIHWPQRSPLQMGVLARLTSPVSFELSIKSVSKLLSSGSRTSEFASTVYWLSNLLDSSGDDNIRASLHGPDSSSRYFQTPVPHPLPMAPMRIKIKSTTGHKTVIIAPKPDSATTSTNVNASSSASLNYQTGQKYRGSGRSPGSADNRDTFDAATAGVDAPVFSTPSPAYTSPHSASGLQQSKMQPRSSLKSASIPLNTPLLDPYPTCGTLDFTAQWIPGISYVHRNVVNGAGGNGNGNHGEREVYRLWEKREEFRKALQGEETKRRKEGSRAASFATVDGVSEDDNDDEINGESKTKNGQKKRSGGTVKWMKHGFKVASKKVRNVNKHQPAGPEQDIEIQSSL